MSRSFTAAELIELGFPELPADKGALSRLIDREGWRSSPFARETERGWEYGVELLPVEAQARLVAEAHRGNQARSGAWDEFDAMPAKAKAEAQQRLAIIDQVDALAAGGKKMAAAVAVVARQAEVSVSTLWGWLNLVQGVARADRLPALAPRRKGRTATVDCDPRAWDFFIADYLRPERPSFTACYRRLQEAATANEWAPVPALKTLQRRLERAVPAASITLKREGREALARTYPHQRRDRSEFAAMQAVNADGHKFDVFVRWEDGTIGRPLATVVQDLGTGMILGYRIAQSENWSAVRLAFADVIEHYGIPEHCYLDNGRAFASKWLTGGMKTRFRFKVRDDDPRGILTQLGIQVHWTTPYHGQAKPIERAFRDWCEEIAKHPRCAGAYTGNGPGAKPENYGSKAIPIAEFREVVAAEVERHNRRPGRRGSGLNGQSFADAFETSLKSATVIRATAAQRRLFLMAAEGVSCERRTGEIALGGNRYWADELVAFRGQQVVVRFDPDNLHQAVGVYQRDGRLICEAQLISDVGFADTVAAQDHARNKRAWMKTARELADIEQRIGIQDVANLLPKVEARPREPAPVVRLIPEVPASPVPVAADQAETDANFSRAIRALAEEGRGGELIPFRKAEAG